MTHPNQRRKEASVLLSVRTLGADTNWKQTSYNGNMRGNYAGIGYTYMSNVATLGVGSTDVFIPQQPYASWTISTTAAVWEPSTLVQHLH